MTPHGRDGHAPLHRRARCSRASGRMRSRKSALVKHFKWVPKGKRRLHQAPNVREIGACLPWLDAEIELIRPRVLVCLGATAAKALLGRAFRVSSQHGTFVPNPRAEFVMATTHPSAILRQRTSEARERGLAQLVADLARVADVLRA